MLQIGPFDARHEYVAYGLNLQKLCSQEAIEIAIVRVENAETDSDVWCESYYFSLLD